MTTLLLISSQIFAAKADRWYTQKQIKQGEILFKQHCATCHGQNAESTANWKQTDANGLYSPPPLNGTAHAWHHDIHLLRRTVRQGGQKLGGVMPPFEDKLSESDIDKVIAYFQSKWPDDIYQKWAGRFDNTELPSLNDVVDAMNSSITRLLKQRLGKSKIGEPQKTALKDVWQVKLQNGYVYLLEGGKYALIGDLIDLENGRNLTEISRRKDSAEALSN